jgi:hypothetical protein
MDTQNPVTQEELDFIKRFDGVLTIVGALFTSMAEADAWDDFARCQRAINVIADSTREQATMGPIN